MQEIGKLKCLLGKVFSEIRFVNLVIFSTNRMTNFKAEFFEYFVEERTE
jgi:hypothetical protein